MIKLRDYQQRIVEEGYSKLLKLNLLYLSMEVRTGKTLTALSLANKFTNKKGVLFVTKKKAIKSIENDYDLLNPDYKITVINYESLHKVEGDFDIIIIDNIGISNLFTINPVNILPDDTVPNPIKIKKRPTSQLITYPNVIFFTSLIS